MEQQSSKMKGMHFGVVHEVDMEELLEQKILECSCYRKWLHKVFKEAENIFKDGSNAIQAQWVSERIQECFDEIEQIKDQRR